MTKATIRGGKLDSLFDCYITVGNKTIYMDILPDIEDRKNVEYQKESGIGRASPFNIYKYSEIRSISWTCHFIVQSNSSSQSSNSNVDKILDNIRTLQAACYPEDDYGRPPPICQLRCGDLLENSGGLCAVLKSYALKFDTSVPWDEVTLLPYKIDMDLQFDVVYNQQALPISSKILQTGY